MNQDEKNGNQHLLVTIRCLAYNHEPYIGQCLNGFVMQKTDFKFEVVVHDDASTDGTAEIIREYAERYPDIIKPIFESENQYSKNDGSLRRIVDEACKGKYIALCEGDDYWTDSMKLQKQVNFLEDNPEYSMCFHNAMEHWEDNSKPDRLFSNITDRSYTGLEMFSKWIVPTASVVYRREICESDFYKRSTYNRKFVYGDIVLFLNAAHHGKVFGMSDIMSVYRRQETGMVYKYDIRRQERFAYHCLEVYKVFGREYKDVSKRKFAENAFEVFLNSRTFGKTNYRVFYKALLYSPMNLLNLIVRNVRFKKMTLMV